MCEWRATGPHHDKHEALLILLLPLLYPLVWTIGHLRGAHHLHLSPPKRKEKYSQSAAMYPGAIGQLPHAGGIVLSLNDFLRSRSSLSPCRTHLKAHAAAFRACLDTF